MRIQESFFDQVQLFIDSQHRTDSPDDEVTVAQQLQFFHRIEELASPMEMDISDDLIDKLRQEYISEEDLVIFLGLLYSSDYYKIFGADVYLDCSEHISTPEKSARLLVCRTIGQDALTIVSETDVASVECNQATHTTYPNYDHKINQVPRRRAKSAEEKLIEYLMTLPERDPLITLTYEEFLQRIKRREIAKDKADTLFTQERWIGHMAVLDVVAQLKELGIADTEDLVSDS